MGGAASALLQQADQGVVLLPKCHVGVSDEFAISFTEKLHANQINFVLGEKNGREAYEAFLSRKFPEAHFDQIEYIEDDTEFKGQSDALPSRKQGRITDIIKTYERPTENDKTQISSDFDNKCSELDRQTGDQPATLTVLKVWHLFLESEEFLKWRHDCRKTTIRFRENLEDIIEEPPRRDDELETTSESTGFPSVKSIDLEFERLSRDQQWLTQLLSSVEQLPLCISVASARKGEQGFPLIYVNKFFETTTGYSREQILGQNCKFLQTGPKPGQRSQQSSVARLRTNLRDGKPVKVVITNYRKDGSPFMNLLALKPIFDSEGEYAFVVGIQFDIGDGNANTDRLEMVEKIMVALPDKLAPQGESSDINNLSLINF